MRSMSAMPSNVENIQDQGQVGLSTAKFKCIHYFLKMFFILVYVHVCTQSGTHKLYEAAPRSIRMIAWNSDVLTTAARLCPHLGHSYVTAATEATQVYNYCSNCPIWSMTGRSKFLFRTSLFSVVGRFFVPLRGAYELLTQYIHCTHTCIVLG